jgi:sulfite dehydrogenase
MNRSGFAGNMSRRVSTIFGIAFPLFLHAAVLEIQLPPEVNAFKQDVGAEIANAQCLICHSVEYVSTQPPSPRAFWKSSIQKMQQKYGAAIPEAQVDALTDYLTRNYGSETNGTLVHSAANQPGAQPTAPASPASASGPRVAEKYGCLGCHNANVKIVGPAYREIAAKYRADSEAATKITQQIRQGGSGKWGPIIMPPFPQVTPSETRVLSEWIMGLK